MGVDRLLPEVSVVIPVWGDYVDEHLPRALESVLKQDTKTPIELIIVDNAHERSIPAPSNATVIRSESQLSLGGARNLGLHAVKTDYMLFLDADDELVSGIVDLMYQRIVEDAQLSAVAPRLVGRETGEPYHWPHPWTYWLARRLPKLFFLAESYRPCFPVNASLIRTRIAQDTLGYGLSPRSAEDWLFGVSLALRGGVLLIEDEGLIYESRPSGVWSKQKRWRKQATHRAEVRARLRADSATPRWLRLLLPLLAVAHECDALRKLFA